MDGNMVTNNLNGATAVISFRERVSYDPNGNILRYTRNNAGTYQSEMDNLRYFYYPGTNQLKHVTDTIPDTKYGSSIYEVVQDIDSQPDSNYVYDAIGNLVQNKQEKITSIKWNVYGKITEINRDAQTDEKRPTYWLRYQYDAAGNRIGKTEKWLNKAPATPVMTLSFTWYVRDAQGNLISTYAANTTDMTALDTLQKLQVFFNDYQVYGSSRLGSYSNGFNVDNGPIDRTVYTNYATAFSRGWRQYELTNHLGNVLTTISDKKNGVSSGPVGSLIDYYEPELVNAQDYFPFGMVSRLNAGASQYRFGFNGKENDNEVKGYGGQQDYGMRIYDPALGRFLSVDPITAQYPELTPYQFASNRPVDGIDLDGLEHIKPIPKFGYQGNGYDIAAAIDNGGINVVNGFIELWNCGVNTFQSLKRGTWLSDTGNEFSEAAGNIKGAIVKEYEYRSTKSLKVQLRDAGDYLTSPEALESLSTMGFGYLSGKVTANLKGSLKAPTKATTTPQNVPTAIVTNEGLGLARKPSYSNWGGEFLDDAGRMVEQESISAKGRLGKLSTRLQIEDIGTQLEKRGYTITGGGGRAKEEFLKPIGKGRKGGSYLDITATHPNFPTLRINTVDMLKNGTPTPRELKNAARIRLQIPKGEHLLLIPKR